MPHKKGKLKKRITIGNRRTGKSVTFIRKEKRKRKRLRSIRNMASKKGSMKRLIASLKRNSKKLF